MEKNEESFPLLKYRLIGASTEDPESPFYSIVSGLKNNGWSSVRYSTYPQELLIQLCRPCRLRQINLVFHQYKIPSKVELYSFFPKTFSDFNLDIEELVFDKIGYIIPDTNMRTRYQAREFKKIFLNVNVYYLKFVFHQNYSNIENKHNQVGLVSIQCFGVDFSANNINGLYPNLSQPNDFFTKESLIPQVKKKEQYNDNMLDEVCISKIQELKEALNLTLKIENYDQSKKIHDMIQIVRKIGEKINDVKETKNKALEINDFDTCKIAKNTIEALREKVRNIDIGYLGYNKKNEEEEKKDDITEPSEEVLLQEKEKEKEIPQQEIAVKGSEIGDEDESIRETVKYNS